MKPNDPSWLILADDLTGAADAAGAFRRHGYRSHLRLSHGAAPEAGRVVAVDSEAGRVVAIDLDAREKPDGAAAIRERLDAAIARAEDRRVYLKIDSTLRGPVRSLVSEARAALLARRLGAADSGPLPLVLCPAFPAQARTTRDGIQYAAGLPVRGSGAGGVRVHRMADLFEGCGISTSGWTPAEARAAIDRPLPGLLIGDAETEADLDEWVRAGETIGPLLWAGSAGLASALARSRPGSDPVPARPEVDRIVVVSGSANPGAHEQLDRLRLPSSRRAGDPEIHIARSPSLEGPLDSEVARRVVETALPWIEESAGTGWVLTGGATARDFLRRAGVETLEVGGEVEAGIPWLLARGGPLDGRPIVTKAGGFGDSGALERIAAFLGGGHPG